MSKNLTDNAVAEFDAEVKHAYQLAGLLRGTVRFRSGVVGATHRFPKMGKGTATQRTPQTDVVPMNITHTNATATLTDWNAPEYTDIFDEQKVNYDERAELAETIAGAIGRREDQLIIDAIDGAATSLTVSTDLGGTGTGMNTTKFRRARRLLSAGGVPKNSDRAFVMHSIGMEQLLGDSDADTVDKNVIKALFDGDISHWLGFDIVELEDRDEGGLALASSVRTNLAYHKAAVGLAVGIDFRTEVNYIPHKTSWLANGIFSAGSVGIDTAGIVEVSTTE